MRGRSLPAGINSIYPPESVAGRGCPGYGGSFGIPLERAFSFDGQRKVSRGRRLFCQLALGKRKYPGAEVARFLGVTTSAVIRAAYSEELPELQKYL